ncbi:hypothetical protein BC940DRAFT_233987 [Gongronella butleri]|nr:hypothetical protein BC940DRAFT_233987 [Gongronella butleri]
MPSPTQYRQPPRVESNKTEFTPEVHDTNNNNAYEFSGTRFGNQENSVSNAYTATPTLSASSPAPPPVPTTPRPTNETNDDNNTGGLPPAWDDRRMHPSKWRLLLRFIQFIASIGHLGFAAGASPYSGEPVPFDSAACFYYLFAVAILSIIWSCFQMSHYCMRRFSKSAKMNRPIMLGIDLLLTLLWGIGVIVEVAKYNCPPGTHNGWCNFYNVSIFWGFLAFASFIAAVGWDTVGGCITHKR